MTLADWMREEGLNQEQAQERLCIDQSTISRILAGAGCGDKTKLKIFNGTDGKVTPNDLLGIEA